MMNYRMKSLLIKLILLLTISVPGLFSQVPEVNISNEQSKLQVLPGGLFRLDVHYQIPENQYQGFEENLFTLEPAADSAAVLEEIIYPEGKIKDGLRIFKGDVTVTGMFRIPKTLPPGGYTLDLKAKYQLCADDGTCYFPGGVDFSIPMEVMPAPPIEVQNPPDGNVNILWFLLLALAGGLLLNVMPCVLPVLSLKALSLVHQGENDKKQILLGGWLYAAGIILSLFVFATVVTIIKLSGERVGWGFQFQNTGFVIVLIALIYLFALSLFEVFIITLPGMNKAAGLSGRKGALGSFLSGIFAVLLATPCTAPFLGTALGFAFSQPPVIIYLIFLFVGLGLSLPFLLLGFFPGIIKALPKPGNWMNTFREIMGFLLIATDIWLFTVLHKQIGGTGLIDVLIFLFVLTLAAWIFGRWGNISRSPRTRLIAAFLALVLIAGGSRIIFTPGVETEEITEESPVPKGWIDFDPENLLSEVNQGTPVFLAFSAQWCLTCKTNERTTLLTDWADSFFSTRGITRFYGDYTKEDPVIAEWIERFGRAGVPVYVFFPPSGDPLLLPEVLSRKILEEKIRL